MENTATVPAGAGAIVVVHTIILSFTLSKLAIGSSRLLAAIVRGMMSVMSPGSVSFVCFAESLWKDRWALSSRYVRSGPIMIQKQRD